MAKKVSLEGWIREAVLDPDKNAPCSMLSLVHHGSVKKDLHSVRLGGTTTRTPGELAQLFEGKARTFCQELSGVQQLELLAFYGDTVEPQAFHPFKVTGSLEFSTGGSGTLETEGPTERGLAGQAMRHSEAIMQFGLRSMAMVTEMQGELIAVQAQQIRSLMAENGDAVKLVKDALLEKALVSHDRQMAEIAAADKANMKAALMRYAPALLNTLTGREVFPQQTADTALIETIASKVAPEQLAMIANFLPAEVSGPLLARFNQIFEEREDARIQGNVESELSDPIEGTQQ